MEPKLEFLIIHFCSMQYFVGGSVIVIDFNVDFDFDFNVDVDFDWMLITNY